MLGTSLPTNWSQISKEIPLLVVIIFHKEWDGEEGRSEEKGGRSQMSIPALSLCAALFPLIFIFPLIFLLAPKGLLSIYTRLLL